MICPKCKGAGYIEKELGKQADKHGTSSGIHDGWKFRILVCKRCRGEGEI